MSYTKGQIVKIPVPFQVLACRCAIGTGFALFLPAGDVRRSFSLSTTFRGIRQ
jgi:hypothetical protein